MSWRDITVEQLEGLTNPLLIDVRSPCEHKTEYIPGSVNVPLLSDAERAVVGTIYANQGELQARTEALKIIAPKIPMIVEAIMLIRKSGQPMVIHCWRGGLRSEAVASFLSVVGIDCWRLTGGYKAWRKNALEQFNQDKFDFKPIVLCGFTGVGKTDVLTALASFGACVLDLESLANHRGSVFGSLGLGAQPTQKNFEAELLKKLKSFAGEFVFLEAESRKIGRIALPDCILQRIHNGTRILVSGTLETRCQRILKDYLANVNVQELMQASNYLERLKVRLGAQRCAQLQNLVSEKQFGLLVEALLVEYYDPLYRKQIERSYPYDLEVIADNPVQAARAIYDKYVASVPVESVRTS